MARAVSMVLAAALLASASASAQIRRTDLAASAEAAIVPAQAPATHASTAPSHDDPALRMMIDGEDSPGGPAVQLNGKTKGSGPLVLEATELQQVSGLCARTPNWNQYPICHRVRAYKAAAPAVTGPGTVVEQY